MAISTAAGYTNLPSGNFLPEIYSQKFLNSSVKLQLLRILPTLTISEKLKILATLLES